MNNTRYRNTIIATLLLSTNVIAGEFSGSASVSSDYDLRGISQSELSVAISGGLTYTHDSGISLGTWASQISFADSKTELDGFIGYKFDVSDDVSINGTLIQYTYPGAITNLNYTELMVDTTVYDTFKFSVYYSDNLLNTGKSATYYGGAYNTDIVAGINLSLSTGYYNMNDVVEDSYTTNSVKLDHTFGNMNIMVGYIHNSGAAEQIFGTRVAEDRAIASVSTSF